MKKKAEMPNNDFFEEIKTRLSDPQVYPHIKCLKFAWEIMLEAIVVFNKHTTPYYFDAAIEELTTVLENRKLIGGTMGRQMFRDQIKKAIKAKAEGKPL